MRLLNLRLMRHPENWGTILLMLLIAIFAVNSVSKLVLNKQEGN